MGLFTRLTNVEQNVRQIGVKVDRIETRLDKMDLNGHTEGLRRLSEMAPQMQKLADNADALVAVARDRTETSAFWAGLKRLVRWDQGLRTVVTLVAGALIGAGAYHFIH